MRDTAIFLIEEAVDLLPYLAVFALIAVLAKGIGVLSGAWRARGEISTNLALWLFDLLVIMPVVLLPSLILQKLFVPATGLAQIWAAMPFWLVAVIAVVAGDLIGYWRHRIEHHSSIWDAHAVHHSDTQFNWFTLYRMHPVNRFTTVTIDTFALAMLGLPPAALIANNVVRNIWGAFIHSDAPWRLGVLGTALISPVAHRVHHIDDAALAGRNFATVFTFWDRMFGTWHDGKGLERCATGVEGGSRGFVGEMLRPFPSIKRKSSAPSEPIAAQAKSANA
ncbi:MAG: sterol desaturase family protein [Pseudomonadota bacterium]